MKAEQRWKEEDYAISHVRLRQVAKLVETYNPRTVLDLGCHNGQLFRLLTDVEYSGVDFVQHGEPEFPFLRCNFNEDGFPEDLPRADVIVASGILEYIEDLPRFLTSVRDHLNGGGRFIATYFNMNHISRVARLVLGRSFEVHPDWRGFYSPADFRRCLDQAGFVVERRLPTTSSLRPPPDFRRTVSRPTLIDARPHSPWLAHQLIYVSR